MNLNRALLPLLIAAPLWLLGCVSTPVAVSAPCPKLPEPPPSLMAPAESPTTADELTRLLNGTSQPAPVTPSG